MRTQFSMLSNFSESLYSFKKYNNGCRNNNNSDIEKMRIFLKKALSVELTSRQKICVTSYFLENKKMWQIAQELNITTSAVSRHIKRAINTLKKRSIYYS